MRKAVHAVGVIFEDPQGRILVLKRHPLDPEGKKWGLVGGKVDSRESPTRTAVREVEEEIGHRIGLGQLELIKSYHWEREDLIIDFDVFRLHVLPNELTVELDATESTHHRWMRPDQLIERSDLMAGLYPILEDLYGVTSA
jgi:8-oxo-dGTP pyrophosphatase MutT (NUDIX family)